MFEEARGVELDERLAPARGRFGPAELLRAATSTATPPGWPDAGRIAAGARADLVTVDLDSVRTAGAGPAQAAAFAATAADVAPVIVGGRAWSANGATGSATSAATLRPSGLPDVGRAMSATLVTGIVELVTNDPGTATTGSGPRPMQPWSSTAAWWPGSGPRRRRRRPTRQDDVGGRAVIPGFVDSPAHLVFAGDATAEFAARMAGAAVRRRRHPTTVAATRAASTTSSAPCRAWSPRCGARERPRWRSRAATG